MTETTPPTTTMTETDAQDIYVVRPALTVTIRSQKYRCRDADKPGLRNRVKVRAKTWCRCSRERLWASVTRYVPILDWLPRYSPRTSLLGDVIGGATVGIMHIPQGMAYALLAGLLPITGLYMAFFPVIIYVFLGTSHHVSMGTYAVGSLMMSKVVGELATVADDTTTLYNDTLDSTDNNINASSSSSLHATYNPEQVATVLALTVGFWEVLLGAVQLGQVFSMFLSDMLISGFTTAVAIHVLTSQIKYLFGIPVPRYNGPFKIVYTFIDFFRLLEFTNVSVLVVSVVSVIILVFNNEVLKPRAKKYTNLPIPIELMVVVAGTAASYAIDLEHRFSVQVVGDIPTGLPSPSTPPVELLPRVALDALIIGIVGYTSTFSMSKIFARRQGYTVDATQELYAQGVSNVFGSFFSCGPMAASLSRSLIQEAVGCASLLTAFISCAFIVLVLLFVGPVFETLPNCVLASIIVVSLKGLLLQFQDLGALWGVSPPDGLIWLATFTASVVVDIDYGLVTGVAVSMGVLLYRSQHAPTARLGHVPHTDLYLNLDRYDMAVEVAGVRIFQFGGALSFVNASYFRSKLLQSTGLDLEALTESRIRTLERAEPQTTKKLIEAESKDDTKVARSCERTRKKTQEPPVVPAVQQQQEEEESSAAAATADNANISISVPEVHWLVLEMSGVTYVDTMGSRQLKQLHKELRDAGIALCLASASDRVLASLSRCEVLDVITRELIFHSTHDALTVIAHSQLNIPTQSSTTHL